MATQNFSGSLKKSKVLFNLTNVSSLRTEARNPTNTVPNLQECDVIPVTKAIPNLISISDFVKHQLFIGNYDENVGIGTPTSIQSSANVVTEANDRQLEPNKPVRKRSKKAMPKEWHQNIQKENRMLGREYNCRTLKTSLKFTPIRARKIGNSCNVHTSVTSKFKCYEISGTARKDLFSEFWKMKWGEKKIFIRSIVESFAPTNKGAQNSPRSTSFKFFLRITKGRFRVCRQMFLSTFGIGRKMVEGWLKSKQETPGRHQNTKSPANSFAIEFLQKLPKTESHYCRKSSSKLYLEPVFTTFSQLFEVYLQNCKDSDQSHLSITSFKKAFEDLNMSLFAPKKDLCNTCEMYKVKNISLDEYKLHQLKKERARAEKLLDKQLSNDGHCHVLAVDLQAIKQAPLLRANSFYFKSKLNIFNYTIYNLRNNDVQCYYWNETEGGLSASTFASLLIEFISKFDDQLPIIIYSDGCGYQNRNAVLSNAILNFSMKTQKLVTQKFLEKGHTQMEVDSVHSLIERKSKNVNIRLPSDYLEICRNARKQKSSQSEYVANEVDHSFFRDYTSKSLQRYTSIRPGTKTGDPNVKDLKAIQYDPTGKILFKLNFDDGWTELPKKPKSQPVALDIPGLYEQRIALTESKWRDLQELKEFLPQDCREFYSSLPH